MNAMLFLGLVLTADATKDVKNLEGIWIVESATANGKARDEIKGDKLSFKDGKLTIMGKKKEERGTYKLDASTRPASIDLTEEGKDKAMKGIYKLDGDRLTICVTPDSGAKRPTEFNAKEDSNLMLIELKREKK